MDPVNEPFANLADISRAKELLDWEPLVEITSWIKEYKKANGIK